MEKAKWTRRKVGARKYTHRETPITDGVLRILAKVVKPDGEEGCWLYTGFLDADGYGKVHWNCQQWRPHRLMYVALHGEVEERLFIRHKCDVRNCVNPAHLEVGTPKENSRDMIERERVSRNGGNWGHCRNTSKLTVDDVNEMRRLARAGKSQKAIGEQFGVSQSVAGDAICGQTFTDATEEPVARRGWGPGKKKEVS